MKKINRYDIVGQRFGKLVVLDVEETLTKREGMTYYVARCDCGKELYVKRGSLIYGKTKSCGCLRRITSPGNLKHKADMVTWNDETHTMKVWARKLGVSETTMYTRKCKYGISEKTFRPVSKQQSQASKSRLHCKNQYICRQEKEKREAI